MFSYLRILIQKLKRVKFNNANYNCKNSSIYSIKKMRRSGGKRERERKRDLYVLAAGYSSKANTHSARTQVSDK
jgi:hypothetical protein